MVDQIDSLDSFIFEDIQSNIEAPSYGVLLETKNDTTYTDYRAFSTRWSTELDEIRNLEPLLATGRQLVTSIYVYRSVSRAIQAMTPTTTDDAAMMQYRTVYDILLPEVNKLRDLMRFTRTSQQFFRGVFAAHKDPELRPSENFMLKLIQLLDILIKLDVIKNSKRCLDTDFQAFVTAASFLYSRDPSINSNNTENHDLLLFLGNQSSIISGLKTELIKLEGNAQFISFLMMLCIEMFDNHRYITPEEKFCFLRVIPTCLYFLDTCDDPKRSLVKTKEHNVSHIQKLLKRWPVVPLCGDVYVVTTDVLKDSPSFRTVPEFFLPPPKIRISYDLRETLPQARMAHNEFVALFKDALIHLKEKLSEDKSIEESRLDSDWKELAALTLRGFKLIGDWTSDLLAQTAFKYANPFKDDLSQFQLTDAAEILLTEDTEPGEKKEENPSPLPSNEKKNTYAYGSGSALNKAKGELESPTIAYERAVKYNYRSSERFATVEYMGLIKGVAVLMQNAADILVPVLNCYIHHEVQVFIQHQLRDLIRKFTKSKKKKFPQDELIELMNLVVDWKGGHPPRDDPVLSGKKGPQPPVLPERAVPPSQTQIELLRSFLWGFIYLRGNKDIYAKVFSKYSKEIKFFEEIFHSSFYYHYLTDFSGTIANSSNIGDLWLREHFLEQSGSAQFSIELSLPWILTNHVLEYAPKSSPNIVMMEYLLYPLSIYNDASMQALYVYQKKHLFEEVEAEVNLAFDQLLYKLSSLIYTHYKIRAASLQLDKAYAKSLEVLGPEFYLKLVVPSSRYTVLFEQHHFQLIGRSLDLNRLITQRMNNYFRENLNYALTRFEASSITTIVGFERLLSNIRLTHALMSRDLPNLDNYDTIFLEVNEETSMVSFHGRIVLHVLYEIMGDLCGNFGFNTITQRFIRSSRNLALTPIGRISMPKSNAQFLYGNRALSVVYSAIDSLSEKYFGLIHFKSLIRILGKETLPLVTSEILKNMEIKFKSAMIPFVDEIINVLPSRMKINLPFYDYGTEGTYGIFCQSLTNLISFPLLVSTVFQTFREWGNSIVFLRILDTAMADESCCQVIQAAPFIGIKPQGIRLTVNQGSSPLEKAFSSLNTISQNSTTKARDLVNSYLQNSKMIHQLYMPMEYDYSIFKAALHEIKNLVRSDWCWPKWTASEQSHQDKKTDTNIIPIEATNEFYRIWSGMQFVFCLDIEENKSLTGSSHEIHGDGFFWAGATLIYLLNQQNRFEVFDYGLTVLRIREANPQKINESVLAFLHRVQQVKDINDAIFHQLQINIPRDPPVIKKIHPERISAENTLKSNSNSLTIRSRPEPKSFRKTNNLSASDIDSGITNSSLPNSVLPPSIPGPAPTIPGPAPSPPGFIFDLPPAPTIPDYIAPSLPDDFAPLPPDDYAPSPPEEFAPMPPSDFSPTPPIDVAFPSVAQSSPLNRVLPIPQISTRTVAPTPQPQQDDDDWDPFNEKDNPWPTAPTPILPATLPAVRTVVKPVTRNPAFVTNTNTQPTSSGFPPPPSGL